jgi:HlyD family secretion protein
LNFDSCDGVAGFPSDLIFVFSGPLAEKFQTDIEEKSNLGLIQKVTASGQLSAVVSVDVGSHISGRILALHADFNSLVKKGEIVAEIDPSIYQAVVNQSKGELASAKASLELARLTAERKRELVAGNAGTQAALDKANAHLDHWRIAAPGDGIVIAGKVDVGQSVGFSVDSFPDDLFEGQVALVRKAPITTANVLTYDTVIR